MKPRITNRQLHDVPVRDLMSSVETIARSTPLAEAARRMHASGHSCIVIDMGDPAEGHGILTQKDLLGVMSDHEWDIEGLTAADAMSHPMVSVPATYNVRTCLQQMRMLGVRRVGVVEGARLVGLVTYSDVFRRALEAMEDG